MFISIHLVRHRILHHTTFASEINWISEANISRYKINIFQTLTLSYHVESNGIVAREVVQLVRSAIKIRLLHSFPNKIISWLKRQSTCRKHTSQSERLHMIPQIKHEWEIYFSIVSPKRWCIVGNDDQFSLALTQRLQRLFVSQTKFAGFHDQSQTGICAFQSFFLETRGYSPQLLYTYLSHNLIF